MSATTIPWAEDFLWHDPHETSLLADVLRSGAPTPDMSLGMYIHWGYGQVDPHSAETRTMAAVARGVKTVNHYWYGPYYSATLCAFSEDQPYVRSVAVVNRVLGIADDV